MTELINKLPPLEEIYRALALVGLQLAVLASVLVVISLLVRLVLGRAEAIPALQKYADRSQLIRKKTNKILVLLFVFLGLVILAGNGYLVYQGVDVLDYSRNWMTQLGADFWTRLGIGLAKAVGLFIVALFVVGRIEKVLMKLMNVAKAYKNIKANDESIEVFFTSLNSIQTIAIWLLVAFFAVQVLPFPAGAADALLLILKVYLDRRTGPARPEGRCRDRRQPQFTRGPLPRAGKIPRPVRETERPDAADAALPGGDRLRDRGLAGHGTDGIHCAVCRLRAAADRKYRHLFRLARGGGNQQPAGGQDHARRQGAD